MSEENEVQNETGGGMDNSPEQENTDHIEQAVEVQPEPVMVEKEIDCRGIVIELAEESGDGQTKYSGCKGGEDCPVCLGTGKEKVLVTADDLPPQQDLADVSELVDAQEQQSSPDVVCRMSIAPAPMDPAEHDGLIRDILNAEERAFNLDSEITALKKSYKARIDTEQDAIHDLCERLRAEGLRERLVREYFFWKLGKVITVDGRSGSILSERELAYDDQPMVTDIPASYGELPDKYREMVEQSHAEPSETSENPPADAQEAGSGQPETESTTEGEIEAQEAAGEETGSEEVTEQPEPETEAA